MGRCCCCGGNDDTEDGTGADDTEDPRSTSVAAAPDPTSSDPGAWDVEDPGSGPEEDAAPPCPPCLEPGAADSVTPSVLCLKSTTKICHEHHVYVIMHVIECVDKFLIT